MENAQAQLKVKLQCPQCAAPARIQESSRIFNCGFCNVRSAIVPRGLFRYVMPSRAPEGMSTIYVPYFRFRGVIFAALEDGQVHGEPVSETLMAYMSEYFPETLGLKAEVVELEFLGPETKGHLFEPDIGAAEALESFKGLFEEGFHSEYIGALDLIYAPFYICGGTVYDGVSNRRVDQFDEEKIEVDRELEAHLPPVRRIEHDVHFIPTVCPNCAAGMECAHDSHLVACDSCGAFFQPRRDGLARLGVGHIPGGPKTAQYLPFWRVRADVDGVTLKTRADVIKAANLAKVPQPGDDQAGFHFWVPAFRIASHRFLQLANRVTLGQPREEIAMSRPGAPCYPVTLPLAEAAKGLKSVLADFIAMKEINFPRLPEITVTPKGGSLVYLPFDAMGSELVHGEYCLRISTQTLEHFRKL